MTQEPLFDNEPVRRRIETKSGYFLDEVVTEAREVAKRKWGKHLWYQSGMSWGGGASKSVTPVLAVERTQPVAYEEKHENR